MSQKKLLPASCKSGIYQGFGSAFIWSGSGSSIWGWRPIQIQGFNDQKLKKKKYSWKKFRIRIHWPDWIRIRIRNPGLLIESLWWVTYHYSYYLSASR